MTTDHYEVLGVSPAAGQAEIRAAYRRLMRTHHPDLRPGDPGAEEMARRITAAWSVLRRPTTRAAYDRARAASPPRTEAHRRQATTRPVLQGPPAYSPGRTDYRRAFHLASVRLATAVLAVGVLLMALSG